MSIFHDSERHKNDVGEVFASLDKDKDGALNASDLSSFFSTYSSSVSRTDIENTLLEVGDGNQITKDQFFGLFYKHDAQHDPEEEFKVAFAKFDVDGDKNLSAQDLKTSLDAMGQNLTMDEIQEMIREADVDGTGMLNYEEFVKMVQTM
ncbi:Calmodulin [Smittium mucronatum]|uniref:Calmodulin n=1 Tax=Smittium mucronatum TaxID=133383 RepID=A0A1R0GPX2_9FUNG|nr:Calmodulin [Smittium mucronatum]